MSELKNIIGIQFNFLTVKGRYVNCKHGRAQWICTCVCGKEKVVSGKVLRSNLIKSCGCKTFELTSKTHITHGLSNTSEYRSWASMKNRCYNTKIRSYSDYGGRGITVCDRWLNSFDNFIFDMGQKPTPYHSIDRFPYINGNYEPCNCRWATDLQQVRNQRSNVWIEYNGEIKIQKDWIDYFGTSHTHIRNNIKNGKTFKDIFDKINNKRLLKNTTK